MSDPKSEENYYQLLKVDSRATVQEIVNAYHNAKNAYSKDSIATYSLFSADEAQKILAELEQAYLTLSNIERRSDYDRRLQQPDGNLDATVKASLTEKRTPELVTETIPIALTETAPQNVVSPDAVVDVPLRSDEITGLGLRDLRAGRGLSLEDVSRITKIPKNFLVSIENDDFKKLPVRVYIQGFIKNMAVLYKVDPKSTATAYLVYLDRVAPINPK